MFVNIKLEYVDKAEEVELSNTNEPGYFRINIINGERETQAIVSIDEVKIALKKIQLRR